MIREVIVVEGRDDVEAVKRAVDCECIPTHGYGFSSSLLDELQNIQERRGLIVLTDPDYAGKRIRQRIRQAVPQAKHAYIDQASAYRGDDIGVENAKPETIREALKKVHYSLTERRTEFTRDDMFLYGLEGMDGSKERRIALSKALGIGYGNAKQLLSKLNDFGITRQEVEDIVEEWMEDE